MTRILVIAAALVVSFIASGCGEKPTVTVYKKGQYQGKVDNVPWDNDQFKKDRAAWEKAIKARNNGQNEYARVAANQ